MQGLVTKIFRGLATEPNVLKKCIFEKNQILLIYSAELWDWTLVQGSWRPLGLISKCKVWLTSAEWDCFLFKACCVHYFLSIYFFIKWQAFKNYVKCFLFHLKRSFHSWDIQIFVIFPFLSALSRFKRENGSGIIYDVRNWLAWISRCNF